MKMINSISITNFQAHKKTEIEFDPGVNVVTGPSDAGKSSVLRAMLWVINNRPSGDSIKNWDCKKDAEVRVGIQLDNGLIGKGRVNGKSSYVFCESPKEKFGLTIQDDIHYEAIKTDVPSEIAEALNLSDINIQAQHDSYFLLNDSPGEVARRLNELTGLDIIDKLFKFINSKTLSTKRSIDDEATLCKTLSDQISDLDYIDRLEVELDELEKLVEEKSGKLDRFVAVANILQDIGEADEASKIYKHHVDALPKVEGLLDCCAESISKRKQIDAVSSIVNSLWETIEKIQVETEWLKVEEGYNALIELFSKYHQKKVDYNLIESLVHHARTIDGDVVVLGNKLIYDKAEYEKLLKKHKICPLCGSKVDAKMIGGILS